VVLMDTMRKIGFKARRLGAPVAGATGSVMEAVKKRQWEFNS